MSRPAYSTAIAARIKTIALVLAPFGALTAFAAHTGKIRAPESGRIVGLSSNIGARGGTHVTSALAVATAGGTVGTFDVDTQVAGTLTDIEGTSLANTEFAKDSTISVVTTEAGGTSPTWQNVILTIDYVPIGD